MYKNRKPGPNVHRWGDEGANDLVLRRLLRLRQGIEDSEVTRENFEGSHTYLWLLEAGSCAPKEIEEILAVYYAEEKDGVTGFVNALLRLDRDNFNIPSEE